MISAAVTDEHDKTAVIAKPYRTVGNPGCEAAKDKFLNALCGHLRFFFLGERHRRPRHHRPRSCQHNLGLSTAS